MQRKRLSSVVIVAFLLLVGLLIASQYPNLFVSAEGEPQQSAETAPTTYPESEPRTVSAIPVFLDNPYQIADIAEAANPATVYIQVKWPMQDPTSRYRMSLPFGSFFDFFWGMPFSQPTQPITQGSGFIIDESGIVLTNQHVVGSAGQEQEITPQSYRQTSAAISKPGSSVPMLRSILLSLRSKVEQAPSRPYPLATRIVPVKANGSSLLAIRTAASLIIR